MKGIILAGGTGSRLSPLTKSISKHLLPVFDKPLIYFPLCTLISAGIKNILVITKSEDKKNFVNLLSNGNQWGVKIEYAVQDKPKGIAEAFIIGEKFIGKDQVTLILGDNIFYGFDFKNFINKNKNKAKIFLYKVKNPSRYGVAEIKDKKIISIEEKPSFPKSKYAVTGIYSYDNKAIEIAKSLKPSNRNELEITDLNNQYIKSKNLLPIFLSEGSVWLDAGTSETLLQASQFVQTIQNRQQIQISCPEELAWKSKLISNTQINNLIKLMPNNSYRFYLEDIVNKDNKINN